MKFLARIANALGESSLDVHVNIFQFGGPFEISGQNVFADRFEPVNDCRIFFAGKNSYLFKHSRMGH